MDSGHSGWFLSENVLQERPQPQTVVILDEGRFLPPFEEPQYPQWFKGHIRKLSLFASAENLFTLTKFYQGYDPEVGYDTNGANGVSLGAVADNYPQVKTYTFGLELKF